MKADQERVKQMLTETILLLCKNGLHFQKHLTVQGLIGITLDETEIFMIHINEIIPPEAAVDLSDLATNGCETLMSDDENASTQDDNFTMVPPSLSVSYVDEVTPENPMAGIKSEPGETQADARELPESKSWVDDFSTDICLSKQPAENEKCDQSKEHMVVENRKSDAFLMGQDALLSIACSSGTSEQRKIRHIQNDLHRRSSSFETKRQFDSVQNLSQSPASSGGSRRPYTCSSQYPSSSLFVSRYRSKNATDKEYHCTYPGCSLSFYARRTLLRHQTQKHGRPKSYIRYGGRTYNMSDLYLGHS